MNNNGDAGNLPHQNGDAGNLPHDNVVAGAQHDAAHAHQNVVAGAQHGAAGPHFNAGGADGYNPVLLGLDGFDAGLVVLDGARERIGTAVERIKFELALYPVEVNRPVLYYAFRDAISAIANARTRINDSMGLIDQALAHHNGLVVFPNPVRTIAKAVSMMSTSAMAIHSILVFVSELRVDGHGPRWRIQYGLNELHLALSQFQRFLDHFFKLEPPGFVYEEDDVQQEDNVQQGDNMQE